MVFQYIFNFQYCTTVIPEEHLMYFSQHFPFLSFNAVSLFLMLLFIHYSWLPTLPCFKSGLSFYSCQQPTNYFLGSADYQINTIYLHLNVFGVTASTCDMRRFRIFWKPNLKIISVSVTYLLFWWLRLQITLKAFQLNIILLHKERNFQPCFLHTIDRFPKNPEDCVSRGDLPPVPRMQETSGCLSELRPGGVTTNKRLVKRT